MRNTEKSIRRKMAAGICAAMMLVSNAGMVTTYAGPLADIENWFTDRAEDASKLAAEAGEAIGNSTVGKFISDSSAAIGSAINEGTAAAGQWLEKSVPVISSQIGEGAAAAGNMIGEGASAVGSWFDKNVAWLTGKASELRQKEDEDTEETESVSEAASESVFEKVSETEAE